MFICRHHLGVLNIRAVGVLNNTNALNHGEKTAAMKWNMTTLNNAHQAKKQRNFDSG